MKARCNGQGPPGRECTASEIERALATDDGEHQQSDLLPPMSNRAALLKPGQISSLGERAEDVQKRRSLEKLPSWDSIDQLKEQYFESVFPLFCIFSSIQFADDFKAFRQNPDAASLSWIALLFAILALACQARERSERDDLLNRRLSVTYENAAWGCLFINDAPDNSSTNALQAVILILYGRVHRGENVTKNLQTAYDMASFISCHQCPAQALACEEHGMIWAGLKMLLSLNSQVHNDCVDEEVSRSLHLRAGVDHKKLAEIQIRYLKLEVSSLPETTFTMLQLHVLGISDTIAISIKQGLLSESSLPGVVDELSRMEKYCQELGTRLSTFDSRKDSRKGPLDILRYNMQYLCQSLHYPYLERYLGGDRTPDTQIAAEECVDSAIRTLKIFCSLMEDEEFQDYAWYLRGAGRHYAIKSKSTLCRGLEAICTGDRAREAEHYCQRAAKSCPSIFLEAEKVT